MRRSPFSEFLSLNAKTRLIVVSDKLLCFVDVQAVYFVNFLDHSRYSRDRSGMFQGNKIPDLLRKDNDSIIKPCST